jgi:putative membrane protein
VPTIGLGMVILGVALLAWSLWRYYRVYHEIETLTFTAPKLGLTVLTIAIIPLGAVSTIVMIAG